MNDIVQTKDDNSTSCHASGFARTPVDPKAEACRYFMKRLHTLVSPFRAPLDKEELLVAQLREAVKGLHTSCLESNLRRLILMKQDLYEQIRDNHIVRPCTFEQEEKVA